MKNSTINRLNQINQHFYETVAEEFSSTRQQPWLGWKKLLSLPEIKQKAEQGKKLFVLDFGCGNGRFGQFLVDNHINLRYLGIDSNQKLLNFGLKQVAFEHDPDNLRLEQFDVIQNLIEAGEAGKGMDFGEFDLVVAFGILHHLPSLFLRKKFIQLLANQIDDDGLAVITAWRFDRDKNLMNRQRNFNEVQVENSELEANDYLLDWQRGTSATRYCHLVLPSEMSQLLNGSGLELVGTFTSDGQSENLNDYYLCKKENKSTLSL